MGKIFFRIWVRFYLILAVWSFLMASLVEMSFNTLLTVCELEDDLYVQITFTLKIMDLSHFIFPFLSFSSYDRGEGIGLYIAE